MGSCSRGPQGGGTAERGDWRCGRRARWVRASCARSASAATATWPRAAMTATATGPVPWRSALDNRVSDEAADDDAIDDAVDLEVAEPPAAPATSESRTGRGGVTPSAKNRPAAADQRSTLPQEGVESMPLEAAAAQLTKPEAAARASGIMHPPPPAILLARSTRAAPFCHVKGMRISSRGVCGGERKVEGARSGGLWWATQQPMVRSHQLWPLGHPGLIGTPF